MSLPCGQCIGCRLERSRQWAMRCLHEASLHKENCFITLTYDDAHVPSNGSLDYGAFQSFMRRFRKRVRVPLRFYMCGEYGSENYRPHYHACIFGFNFADRELFSRRDGIRLFTSKLLDELWPFGFCSIGEVTFESAAYVARYCVAKRTGDARVVRAWYDAMARAAGVSGPLEPEFNGMSLKPGIGAKWLEKWETDVYPHDYVVINGRKVKPPKYYDKIFSGKDPDRFEDIKFQRECLGRSRADDNTDARLAVRAQVAASRNSFNRRDV